jgi:hypothetical protein
MHDTGRYMRLDSSALRALNVLPERSSGANAAANAAAPDAASGFSIYGRGLHSSTIQLNLSRFWHKSTP